MACAWDAVERRPLLSFTVDSDRGRVLVVLGIWQGRLVSPWMGMPATQMTHLMRSLEAHLIVDGAVAESTVMLDLLDLAAQCGRCDSRYAVRSGVPWPAPRVVGEGDGRASSATIAAWLSEVADPDEDLGALLRARHLSWLDPSYRWHGPAAVGSFEGGQAFVAGQQHPFRRSFSSRRSGSGAADHRRVVHGASGSFVASGSWPAILGRHTGDDWLGVPASGAEVAMRMVDVYAVAGDRIVENWVMIDMVHALAQMGVETGFCPAG